MTTPDFSVYEEPIKKDIEEYYKLYKTAYSEEQVLLKQIKDNLEMLEFLHFEDSAKDIFNKLEAAQHKIDVGCEIMLVF